MTKRAKIAPYAALHRQYEVNVARARLEIVEGGHDDDATDAAVDRMDECDRQICATVRRSKPPSTPSEIECLLRIAMMWLDEYEPALDDERDYPVHMMIGKAIEGFSMAIGDSPRQAAA